jgi:hypothetical protein
MEGASLTCHSSRECVQTSKASGWSKRRLRATSSDTEDIIEVIEEAPAAPQAKRTAISSYPKGRIVVIKVKALAIKVGERPAVVVATPNQPVYEISNININI